MSEAAVCVCGATIQPQDSHLDCPVWVGRKTARAPRAEGEVRKPVVRSAGISASGLEVFYYDTSHLNAAEYRAWVHERALERDAGIGFDIPHRLQKLGVPADPLLALRRPKHTLCIRAAERFLQAPRALVRTLLLAGEKPGIGKTTAAAFVLWKEAEKERDQLSARWVRAGAITQAAEFGRVDPEWMEGLRKTSLLVLDELGAESTTAGLAALQDLLSERHEKQRRTVLTTNMNFDSFRKRYGDAIADRIAAAGITPDLREAESLRKRGAA